MTDTTHSTASSVREKLIEHLFMGELLKQLWIAGHRDVEVLRAEVDARGYDVVIETGGTLRHIQLKASAIGAKTSTVTVNLDLAKKPSGCIVWIWFNPETLDLGPLLWFGGAPGERLPDPGDRIARHTKANSRGEKAERSNHRVVNKGRFVVTSANELADRLFG